MATKIKSSIIDRTADLEVNFEAETLEDLFRGAFIWIGDTILEHSEARLLKRKVKVAINLFAPDSEELFHRWLEECIYYADARKAIPTEVEINISSTGNLLHAVATFTKVPQREYINPIKAITHHNFYIIKEDDRYKANVVFDT